MPWDGSCPSESLWRNPRDSQFDVPIQGPRGVAVRWGFVGVVVARAGDAADLFAVETLGQFIPLL
jgi:hypothetical protein